MQPNTDSLDQIDLTNSTDSRSGEQEPTLPEMQKLWQRKTLFWVYLSIILLLYGLFALLVGMALCSDAFFATLTAHKHMGILIAALLIVPSILLWGLARSAYSPEKNGQNLPELIIKLIKEGNPLSGE